MANWYKVFTIALIFTSACSGGGENSTVFEIKFENVSSSPSFTANNGSPVVSAFSSLVGTVHDNSKVLFTSGSLDYGQGLADLAENADVAPLVQSLRLNAHAEIVGIANDPSSGQRGILAPGEFYTLTLSTIDPTARLSMVASFLQANDVVAMTKDEGIPLFDDAGNPTTGNVTAYFDFYDVGVEVNQPPGVGSNQVIRQGTAPQGQISAGTPESKPVSKLNDGFTYPTIGQSIRVTITTLEVAAVKPSPSKSPSVSPSQSSSPSLSPSSSASKSPSASPSASRSASISPSPSGSAS